MFWNVKIVMPRRMISVMRHFPLICIDYHYIVVMKQLCRKKFLEVSCLGFICFFLKKFSFLLFSLFTIVRTVNSFVRIYFVVEFFFFFNITSLSTSLLPSQWVPHLRYVKYLSRVSFVTTSFHLHFLSSQGTSLNRIHNPSFNSHSSFFANNIFGNKAHDDGVKNIYFIF